MSKTWSIGIQNRSFEDLIYLLQRQYPDGVTTFGPCPICGADSRGGVCCANCICSEMHRRGVPSPLISRLNSLLEMRRDLHGRIDAVVDQILKDAK